MIVVDGITKYYGGQRALSDVSFQINQGEVVGFLGLNGAGKSTMLKILSGLLLPSFGRFSVGGVDGLEEPRALRARIGFLPDRPPLYEDMTVTEMLTYAGRLHGGDAGPVKIGVERAISSTNLDAVRHTLVAHLSHGYRQRVGIAQAIVHRPSLVILDEPISGLDPVQIVEMRNLVKSLGQEHTVLLSSHILSEIAQTCDRILVLDEGRVVAEGTEETLTRRRASGRIVVVMRGDEEKATMLLNREPGVEVAASRPMGDELFELHLSVASDEARERAVVVLVEGRFGVRDVRDEDQGLESVFLRILKGSNDAAAPGATRPSAEGVSP